MSGNLTVPTDLPVQDYLDAIEDDRRRADCEELAALMRRLTGHEPVLWGSSLVGFGLVHYRYATGREGDWFLLGFSSRKANLSLHLVPGGFAEDNELLARLGPHKTGKGCLYIKRLDDIDRNVLEQLLIRSLEEVRRLYPETPGA